MPSPNRVDVQRVRELIAKGCTAKQISMRLGCNKTSIHAVVKKIRSGEIK